MKHLLEDDNPKIVEFFKVRHEEETGPGVRRTVSALVEMRRILLYHVRHLPSTKS